MNKNGSIETFMNKIKLKVISCYCSFSKKYYSFQISSITSGLYDITCRVLDKTKRKEEEKQQYFVERHSTKSHLSYTVYWKRYSIYIIPSIFHDLCISC